MWTNRREKQCTQINMLNPLCYSPFCPEKSSADRLLLWKPSWHSRLSLWFCFWQHQASQTCSRGRCTNTSVCSFIDTFWHCQAQHTFKSDCHITKSLMSTNTVRCSCSSQLKSTVIITFIFCRALVHCECTTWEVWGVCVCVTVSFYPSNRSDMVTSLC